MEPRIRAAIVDDEPKAVAVLENLLRDFCPEVDLVWTAGSVKEGKRQLEMQQPDLLFLDIAMPDGQGFEIPEAVPAPETAIIFTTAYSEYATRAFRMAALHYLLKPIDPEELQQAVSRYRDRQAVLEDVERLDIFRKGMQQTFEKIALPSMDSIDFVELKDIVRCEAQKNYTEFHLAGGKRLIVSKSLNNYEQLLSEVGFFRTHNKHLVNLRHVKKYLRGKGGQVLLSDGATVDVSIRRKEEFLQKMAEIVGAA